MPCRSPTGLSSPSSYLRFQLPHAALAELYRVHRSTVTRAIGEVRPLLAARGFAVPGEPGIRLRTLADVFAYASARGVTLRIDGTEVQVRRHPGEQAGTTGRSCRARRSMNTKKATVITDEKGRTLWAGAFRPGRMHDQTAVRTEGIADLLPPVPAGQSQGRCRVPGAGQGIPGPGPGSAADSPKKNAPPGRDRRIRDAAPPAVIRAHLRRARQRRAQAMAHPPAVQRTTRALRRDLRRPSPAWSPTAPRNGNSSEPTRQASTPQR